MQTPADERTGPRAFQPLKRLLLACTALLPLCVFLAALAIGTSYFRASIQEGTRESLRRVAEDHRQMLDAFLSERRGDMVFLARTFPLQGRVAEASLPRLLEDLQQKSSAFTDLGILDEEGRQVAYVGPYPLAGKVYAGESWFQETLEDGFTLSDVFLGFRRVPHILMAILKEEGGRRWVLRASIDTHLFSELVRKVRIGKTGEAYLLNAEGVFQSERRSGGALMQRHEETLPLPSTLDEILTFEKEDSRGEAFFYATAWLRNKAWVLVVRQEVADARASLRSAGLWILVTLLLGGSGIVVIAYYLTERVLRRLKRMETERERLGQQLLHAGRLAELGEMSAGLAHEINNPLQIMNSEHGLIETIMDDMRQRGALPPSEDLAEIEDSLRQIKIQIERCGKITKAILRFGREGGGSAQALALQAFLPEILGLVTRRATSEGIRIEASVPEDLPRIPGDPSQLQQVLLNLMNNAMDAVLARHGNSGGVLRISCGLEGRHRVRIAVEDNGPGIPPGDRERLFTPFFTTKPPGKGTGLGLSVCYGIVEKMGGRIEVESEPGRGSTFIVLLPVAQGGEAHGTD